MADLKISQLSAVSEVQGTDVFPTVSGLATMKASAAQIKTYVTESLDVNDSAVAGSYVTAVSEADGVISVTRETADVKPTANSTKMLTSGGAKAALDEKQNTLTFDNTPTANSNNPVKSGGVYTEVNSLKETLTNEVRGNWATGGKNIAQSYKGYALGTRNNNPIYVKTTNGILSIAKIEQNKTYIISKSTSGDRFRVAGFNSNNIDDDQVEGVEIANIQYPVQNTTYEYTNTAGYKYLAICFNANTDVTIEQVEPMVRDSNIADPTYVPYAKTNQQLTQETTGLISNDFTNGAVNLLENTASSQVLSGVTFVVNDDGTVTANATGTVSSIYFPLHTYSNDEYQKLFAGKTLKISGTPSNAVSGIKIYAELNGTTVIDETNAPIATLPTTSGTFIVYIRIPANSPVSNLVFKPMITVADMPNSDYNHYVPYAKSNKELTDIVSENNYQFIITNSSLTSNIWLSKRGNVVVASMHINVNTAISAQAVLGTVPDAIKPEKSAVLNLVNASGNVAAIQVTYDGSVIAITPIGTGYWYVTGSSYAL